WQISERSDISPTYLEKRPAKRSTNLLERVVSSLCRCSRAKNWQAVSASIARRSGLFRETDSTAQKLRRPGRHRYRERTAAQRIARVPRAADRDVGSPESY